MRSSAARPVGDDRSALAIARRLLGRAPDVLEPARRGGNSAVFRAESRGERIAVKLYPNPVRDPRDRLGVEVDALRFLAENGIDNVPAVIAVDRALNAAAFTWIEGAPVAAPTDGDVDQMLAFLRRLVEIRDRPTAASLRPASAHSFSGAQAEEQLAERRAQLGPACRANAALEHFMAEAFAPVAQQAIAHARAAYATKDLDFAAALPRAERTLSPSDFGLHNALRRADGTLAFVDFEYFGWDDPAKLVCDTIWHPGFPLGPRLGGRFLAGARDAFRDCDFGGNMAGRIAALGPLFGAIWCLIILNPLLDPRRADGTDAPLQRAQRMLGAVKEVLNDDRQAR